jgi:DnaJ-domain-containing protein 1
LTPLKAGSMKDETAPATGGLDYFALLDEPRRPWLDPELLKQKFLARSADLHPDRAHNAAETTRADAIRNFADLNAAWLCLSEPKERLRHLLELELGGPPQDARDVPAAAMDFFFEVGRLCREADAFLAVKTRTSSPLIQAQMFGAGMELADRLNALQQRIQRRRDELLGELKEMNAAWEVAPAPGAASRPVGLSLDKLEGIHRLFSYIARWTAQIQERVVRLSF